MSPNRAGLHEYNEVIEAKARTIYKKSIFDYDCTFFFNFVLLSGNNRQVLIALNTW